jgi:transketolase
MASGTEVSLIISAGEILVDQGINVRLVSFPSWELFEKQPETYRNEIFPPEITTRLAVEAGVPLGWHKWIGSSGDILGVERYGASAPQKVVYDEYGLTVENVVVKAKALLNRSK